MTTGRINEGAVAQVPMVLHAQEVGWTPLEPKVAAAKQEGWAGTFAPPPGPTVAPISRRLLREHFRSNRSPRLLVASLRRYARNRRTTTGKAMLPSKPA